MMKYIIGLLCFGAWVMCAEAQGLQVVWEDEVTVNDVPALGRVRPRITLAAGNVPVVVWGYPSTGNVYASTMQGDTFSVPVHINTSGPDAYVRNWMGPSVASAGDTVMVTFDQMEGSIGRVYYQRSLDAGATWSDTVRVDVATGDGMSRMGALAAKNGRDLLCGYALADHTDANAEGYMARSSDGGMTWEPAVNMTAGSPGLMCDCCPPSVAVDGDRSAFLFRNNDADVRDIRAAVSSDGGATADTVIDLDERDWIISSCPSTGPDGHIYGDSLYHVWMFGDVSPTKVFTGTHHILTGMGSSVAVDDSAAGAQNFPRMAGKGDTLCIVYREMVSGYADARIRWSVKGLAGLQPAQTVNANSSGTQDLPDVAFADREIHVVWQDDENQRVAYRKGRIVPLVSTADAQPEGVLTLYPQPADDVVMLKCNVAGNYTVNSITGEVVLKSASADVVHRIDVSSLAKGVYLLRFETSTQPLTRLLLVN